MRSGFLLFRFTRSAMMGLIVAGFGLWFCRWVKIDGIWLIWSLIFGFVQWVSVGCGIGFGLILVGVLLVMGFEVARGGLRGGFRWLVVVVPIFGGFWWFWVWVFFFVLFYVTSNTPYRIFSEAFS
jgi:hypothetical protein